MAPLAADRQTPMRAGGYSRTLVGKMAASTLIYNGALVASNAAGNEVPASDTAGLQVNGVAQERVDNSAGAASAVEIRLYTGVFKFDNSVGTPVVLANMHKACYVADDHTVQATGGTNSIKAGIVELIESDGVWVYVGPLASGA